MPREIVHKADGGVGEALREEGGAHDGHIHLQEPPPEDVAGHPSILRVVVSVLAPIGVIHPNGIL